MQFWCFLAFFLAFAIKVPLFPFHTWLPDAHTEAPTAGSIILAGVLLKMGTYGFIRFAMPLFPDAAFYPLSIGGIDFTPRDIIMALAVIGIIYGALVASVQVDVKRLVAYSSVAHLGFVMLGLMSFNQIAVDGAILQMVNHGISTGALFMLVGFIYDRRHTRLIADFGGLAKPMPVYFNFFLVMMLSSVGLAGAQRFRGRVPDPDRHLAGELADGADRHDWRDPGCGVSAVYVPPRVLRRGHARREQAAPGPDAARDLGGACRWV